MAPCPWTCLASAALIIGMIYFHFITNKSKIVQQYRQNLPSGLQQLYDKISVERMNLCFQGYTLGFVISLIFIGYNSMKQKWSTSTMVCSTILITFTVNYFYYLLSPKSDWMLNKINNGEQARAWLHMYREMQTNYHTGMLLGIIAVGVFAAAFR
jgi:hypothetical protein